MKRSADINPVYPYEDKKPNLLPPFFDPHGLTGTAGGKAGILGLKIDSPLTFDSDGDLSLKVGDGLLIDEDGKLGVGNSLTGTSVNPPLEKSDDTLTLNTAGGLEISGKALTLAVKKPLQIDDDNKLTTAIQPPLIIGQNGLGMSLNPPLTLNSTGALGLQLGSGLEISNNVLKTAPLSANAPITVTERTLGLQVGSGLRVQNNQLQIHTIKPLDITNGALDIALGKGFSKNSAGLLTLDVGAPLTLAGGKLSLDIATPLILSNNKLTIPLGTGLEFKNGSLRLKLGKGLSADRENNIYVTDTLKHGDSEVLANTDKGVAVGENGLEIKISDPILFSENGELTLRVGPGLKVVNGTIQLNLGKGMGLTLRDKLTSFGTDYTLWTGPDSYIQNVVKPFTGNVTLSLTRVGSQVLGNVSMRGYGKFNSVLKDAWVTFEMLFDKNGELIPSDSFVGPWGFRNRDGVDETSELNHLLLMPNRKVYVPGERASNSMILTTVGHNAKEVYPSYGVQMNFYPYKKCDLTIVLNRSSTAPYSLLFIWGPFQITEVLDTSIATFSYDAELFQ